jgi:hypothetical protein
MDMPDNRRDRLVMGLSICALILLVANIATFVKQRFFEEQHDVHHAFVVSGIDAHDNAQCDDHAAGHQWHVNHNDGNEVWSIRTENLDCLREKAKRMNEEIRGQLRTREMAMGRARDEHRRATRKRGRYVWRLHGDHVDGDHDGEVEALLEEARRAARNLELDLGLEEMPRLEIESLHNGVDVIESQDEAGRHTYRIVIKPDSERQ